MSRPVLTVEQAELLIDAAFDGGDLDRTQWHADWVAIHEWLQYEWPILYAGVRDAWTEPAA